MVAAGCFQAEGLSDQEHVCTQAEGGIVIMRLEESFCDVLQHQPVHHKGVGRQVHSASKELAHGMKKKRARTTGAGW